MNTVVVCHKQIGPDQETGTDPEVTRLVPRRYSDPGDFASELIVSTIYREVSHFLKVWATDDKLWYDLSFGEVGYIRWSLRDWKLETFVWDNCFGGVAVSIGEGVCETKEGTEQ